MTWLLLIVIGYSAGGLNAGTALVTEKIEHLSERECLANAERVKAEKATYSRIMAVCLPRNLTGLEKF